jgi:hypothetical protein
MGAPTGNQFWKLRSKHGRDRIFESPEVLAEAAYEFFQWCDENPLMKSELIKGGDLAGQIVEVPVMRAYTQQGLCSFLGVNTVYFNDFIESLKGKTDQQSKDFSNVITHIREVLYSQKFTGAAANLLNANIIARDLGLQEKTDKPEKEKETNLQNLTLDEQEQLQILLKKAQQKESE